MHGMNLFLSLLGWKLREAHSSELGVDDSMVECACGILLILMCALFLSVSVYFVGCCIGII
jgi:hypothetical protein